DPLNLVNVRVERYDKKTGQRVWTSERMIVDEFVPPLAVHDTRSFDFLANASVADPGNTELRVFINGGFYNACPVGLKLSAVDAVLQKGLGKSDGEHGMP